MEHTDETIKILKSITKIEFWLMIFISAGYGLVAGTMIKQHQWYSGCLILILGFIFSNILRLRCKRLTNLLINLLESQSVSGKSIYQESIYPEFN